MHKSGRVGRPNQMKSSCSGWPSWRSGNVTCGRLTLPSRRAAVRCALGVSTVAGTVVRYGHPRRLAQWPRGRTLVQCTLGVASRLRVDDVQSIQTKRRRRSMRVVFGGVVEEGCARCLSLPTSHPLSRPPGLGSGLGGLPALKPDNPNPNPERSIESSGGERLACDGQTPSLSPGSRFATAAEWENVRAVRERSSSSALGLGGGGLTKRRTDQDRLQSSVVEYVTGECPG